MLCVHYIHLKLNSKCKEKTMYIFQLMDVVALLKDAIFHLCCHILVRRNFQNILQVYSKLQCSNNICGKHCISPLSAKMYPLENSRLWTYSRREIWSNQIGMFLTSPSPSSVFNNYLIFHEFSFSLFSHNQTLNTPETIWGSVVVQP